MDKRRFVTNRFYPQSTRITPRPASEYYYNETQRHRETAGILARGEQGLTQIKHTVISSVSLCLIVYRYPASFSAISAYSAVIHRFFPCSSVFIGGYYPNDQEPASAFCFSSQRAFHCAKRSMMGSCWVQDRSHCPHRMHRSRTSISSMPQWYFSRPTGPL